MIGDENFVAIGRSGVWGLSAWNLNTKTYKELICSYMKKRNAPASIKEIKDYVESVHSHTKRNSVFSILELYKDSFVRIVDGRYILKDWESLYDTNFIPRKSHRVSDIQLYNALRDIFEANNFKPLRSDRLLKALNKKNILWKKGAFWMRADRCPYLQKIKEGNKNVYTFNPSLKPPEPPINNKKTKEINSIIHKLLTLYQGHLAMSGIVNNLVKNGYNKGTIYSVIDKNPEFEKTCHDKKHVFLSLRKK